LKSSILRYQFKVFLYFSPKIFTSQAELQKQKGLYKENIYKSYEEPLHNTSK